MFKPTFTCNPAPVPAGQHTVKRPCRCKNGNFALTSKQVETLCRMMESGTPAYKVAARFDLHSASIYGYYRRQRGVPFSHTVYCRKSKIQHGPRSGGSILDAYVRRKRQMDGDEWTGTAAQLREYLITLDQREERL